MPKTLPFSKRNILLLAGAILLAAVAAFFLTTKKEAPARYLAEPIAVSEDGAATLFLDPSKLPEGVRADSISIVSVPEDELPEGYAYGYALEPDGLRLAEKAVLRVTKAYEEEEPSGMTVFVHVSSEGDSEFLLPTNYRVDRAEKTVTSDYALEHFSEALALVYDDFEVNMTHDFAWHQPGKPFPVTVKTKYVSKDPREKAVFWKGTFLHYTNGTADRPWTLANGTFSSKGWGLYYKEQAGNRPTTVKPATVKDAPKKSANYTDEFTVRKDFECLPVERISHSLVSYDADLIWQFTSWKTDGDREIIGEKKTYTSKTHVTVSNDVTCQPADKPDRCELKGLMSDEACKKACPPKDGKSRCVEDKNELFCYRCEEPSPPPADEPAGEIRIEGGMFGN